MAVLLPVIVKFPAIRPTKKLFDQSWIKRCHSG
jgi:hypothetical protein